MSGVWVFKNGVTRSLITEEPEAQPGAAPAGTSNMKALVYVPDGEAVASHKDLQRCLLELGWERYGEDPALVQFRRRGDSAELISLPADFAGVGAEHMHDVVAKNPEHFKVVDNAGPAN